MKKLHFTTVPVYIRRFNRWRAWEYFKDRPLAPQLRLHNIPPAYISRLLNMKTLPTPSMAKKLDALTNGAVKYADTVLECQKIRDFSKKKNKELRILKEKMRSKKNRTKNLELYKTLHAKLMQDTTLRIPAHLKTWKHPDNL